jgi:hypothetical protein
MNALECGGQNRLQLLESGHRQGKAWLEAGIFAANSWSRLIRIALKLHHHQARQKEQYHRPGPGR